MKPLHLMLCAFMTLGLSSDRMGHEVLENVITQKQEIRAEELHYYSDLMERKGLPVCLYSLSFWICIGFTGFLGIIFIAAPKVAGVIASGAALGGITLGGAALLVALLASVVGIGAYYVSKQYYIYSPEALQEIAIATRMANGYAHFNDPTLQALRQAYHDDPTKAWDFFWGMYSVDAPYFLCGKEISFYPGGNLPEDMLKALGWPRVISTQKMDEHEWKKFKEFALQILQDTNARYDQKVTAALKILEWMRNATQQDNPKAITPEAREIVEEIIKDRDIRIYLDTQEEMLQKIIYRMNIFNPIFETYGTDRFDNEVDKLKFFNPTKDEQYSAKGLALLKKIRKERRRIEAEKKLEEQRWREAVQKLEKAENAQEKEKWEKEKEKWEQRMYIPTRKPDTTNNLTDEEMQSPQWRILRKRMQEGQVLKVQNKYQMQYKEQSQIGKIASAILDINRTGYDGAIMLRKIISSEANKIQQEYKDRIVTNYKAFYLKLPSSPQVDFTWLNDEKCPDVVRYGLIEIMIKEFEAKHDPADDLEFADNLAGLCIKILREVLFGKQDVVTDEVELNKQVSEKLNKDRDKAVKTIKIITIFFDKLFTANERDRFMGSVGFFDEDLNKRLITLTLWHLKTKYPELISIKLEEYYKANRRWGDYISSEFPALTSLYQKLFASDTSGGSTAKPA